MAGGTRVGGNRALSFTAQLNIEEALRNADKLENRYKELAKIAANSAGAGGSQAGSNAALNVAPISAYRQAQLQMQQALADSRLEIQRLKAEQQTLNNALAQGRITQQAYRTEVARLALEQKQQASAAKSARQAQVAANGSYQQATERLKQLGQQIRSVEGGFASTSRLQQARIREYQQLNRQLQDFDTQMGNNQRRVGAYSQSLGALSTNIQGLIGNYLSFYAVIGTVTRAIRVNSEISDSLADVSRTAGLTTESANALVESLKQIDTRTSLKGLVDIAIIGGQLGIAEKDLTGFTRAIDQLAITLSGEIPGGAEAVASALGKINGVFKVLDKEGTTVEQSFNKTGSAILKLGQVGLATGEFLQDFGLRVAGAANAANISLPTILAYGAVLEEAGSSAEVSGTALNRLIGSLAGKREQFFAIAKIADSTLTLKEFTRVINTDANKALQMFFAGLNKGGVNLTSFNDLLDQIGLRAGPSKNAIVALAQNQDILNERIAQGTEAYNDGTLSAEQFAIKNDTLAGALEKVSKAFDQILQGDGIGKVFKEIAIGLAGTLTYFDKLIGSNSWKEFFFRLDPKTSNTAKFAGLADQADAIRAENDPKLWLQRESSKYKALDEEMQKRALEAQRFRVRNAKIEAQEAIKEYRDNVAKVQKMNSKLSEANRKDPMDYGFVAKAKEAKDKLRDEALKQDALLKSMLKKTVIKGKVTKVDPDGGMTIGDGKEDKKAQAAFNAQRSLQAKIDELTKKGVAKELDADEQELESVKRKYAKMREEAVRFNNNPTNKKRGLRVDSGGLLSAEDNELQSIRAKQETKVLETELDFRKKLYQEYEDFRDRLGKGEADKRFASQLKGERSYLEQLQRMEDEILNRKQGKGADSDGGDLSAIDKARLVEIQKRIKEEKVLEDKKNADLYISAYQAAKTHAQAMLAIEEDYQRNVDTLRKAGSLSAEQQAVLDKNKARALSEASVKELMDSDAWSNLFSNLDERTAKEIDVLLKQIEKQFSTLSVKFDPIDIEAVRAKLNTAREILIKDNPFKQVGISIKEIFSKGADEAGKSASEIKTDWKNLGQATEASFKFVEDAIASADFLKEAIGDVGATAISSLATVAAVSITVAAAIKTAEKASVILAIVQAALVVVQAIANVLGSIFARHDKKIEKSIQKHEDEVKRLGRAYNQLERDIQNAVGKQIEDAQKKQLDNIKMQQAELAKARDAEMSKKKKDQGKIDEYNEQIAQLGQNAIDVQNAINEALTGTTSKSIAESIIAGFKEGKRSAADFADTFKDMMTDAMYKAMSAQYLDEAIAGFYKKFISASEDGLSESELSGLQREWNNIIEKGSVIADNIDKVTGGVAGGSASPNSIQGAYATASQESITLLAGQTSGMRIAQLQTNTILTGIGKTIGDFFLLARDNFNTMLKIEANTLRTANNTDKLESIDASLVALNRKIDNNANAAKAAGF